MAFARATGLLKRAGSPSDFVEAMVPAVVDYGVLSPGLLVTPYFSWEILDVGGASPGDVASTATHGRILPNTLIV